MEAIHSAVMTGSTRVLNAVQSDMLGRKLPNPDGEVRSQRGSAVVLVMMIPVLIFDRATR
jgi:hypothetical protein